jgi:hypothetical protein
MSSSVASGDASPVLESVREPAGEPRRTFSVKVERRSRVAADMIDREAGAVVIHADPLETKTAEGARVQMGFPILVVTGWVAEPEAFAAQVAKLIEDAGI